MSKPEPKAEEPQINDQAAQAAVDGNKQLAELQAKHDEMRDNMMRALADAENTRKRAAKEVEEANKYGTSSLAKDLIIVLENLQRATDTAPQPESQGVKDFIEGINLTRKELLNIFERRGIKRVEPKTGEKFDHNLHQAVAQVEDHKVEPGGVLQVIQAGYILHDRLLRPAMVTVSKGAPQPAAKVDTTA